jgi:hypothetical protein
LDTNRAGIEDRISVTKLGDAINVFVSIIEMLVTNVVQTLMPEEAFGRDMKFLNFQFGRVSMPVNVGNKGLKDFIMVASVFRRGRIGSWRWAAR